MEISVDTVLVIVAVPVETARGVPVTVVRGFPCSSCSTIISRSRLTSNLVTGPST